MSSNVMSVGVMAPLSRTITKEERDEWSEILWEQGSIVQFSYYCDMVYTEESGDEYGITFGEMPIVNIAHFEVLKQFGIWTEEGRARAYRCLWYNGSDSDMDMMTREKFLQMTKQIS